MGSSRRQARGRTCRPPLILGLAALTTRGRAGCPRSRGKVGKEDMGARQVESGGRADRRSVDGSRTLRRHDHFAGMKVAIAQPVPRAGTGSGQGCRWQSASEALPPESRSEPSIRIDQENFVRRRGRAGERGRRRVSEDRALLLGGRLGAGTPELQQGRSVEAPRPHEAEAPLQERGLVHLPAPGPPAAKTAQVIRASTNWPAAGNRP